MSWKPDICIYHFPCDDGFAAAWIARKRWPDIVLLPTNYGQPIPAADYAGKNVLIADFSYKPEGLRAFVERGAATVVVLDHHKTAEADLAEFAYAALRIMRQRLDMIGGEKRNRILAYFDMNRSGAALMWEFAFPGEPMPKMVVWIEDRDLWLFACPETRAFRNLLQSHEYDLDVWSEIAGRVETDQAAVMREAEAITRFYDRQVDEIAQTATTKMIGKSKGVPVAHAHYTFASDVGRALLAKFPDAPFVAIMCESYGARTYSLRSEDRREDVSEIARSFGGGGHRNAAGFRVPL